MASEREAEEAPIHGDVLEAIFSHVPLIHLVPACHVSKAWKRAVSSSLAHVSPIKPWFTILTQSARAPHVTTSHAYDPRSRAWIEIKREPSIQHASAVRSSHSDLLYSLTPVGLSFSYDPLHLSWHHAPPPRVWRLDPVVGRVGNLVVVAGGACDFEDDPLAVEAYDPEARAWVTCQSMPALLKGSTASTWLSVAVVGEKMLVTEKNSGVTYAFDTVSMTWKGPYDLRPEQSVFHCVTGSLGERLTVAGVVGDAENVKGLKLWSVEGELCGSGIRFEEIGEMPKEMVEKVTGGWELSSVEVCWVGDFVYLMNTAEAEEIVVCEVASGVTREWWCVRNVAREGDWTKRMVISGGKVCLEYLQRAAVSGNPRLCIKEM